MNGVRGVIIVVVAVIVVVVAFVLACFMDGWEESTSFVHSPPRELELERGSTAKYRVYIYTVLITGPWIAGVTRDRRIVMIRWGGHDR